MNRREVPPCGTRAAYLRHIRIGEATCDACRAANREYGIQWRALGRPSRRDIDEIAVERAIHGEPPVGLTSAEREAVVHRLYRLGLPDRRIAKHLDIGATGVLRIRQRLGLPAIPPARRAAA